VQILRDVRESTKLLLLLEVTSRRVTRLKELADRLDLTVASVSEYVKAMEKEGLVVHVGGEYRATKRGVEFLQERFLALRDFVESSVREMAIIHQTVALSAEVLNQGDRLGLFMEKGVLVARRKVSPSSGVAARAALPGETVLVRDLEGMVKLEPGRISIVRLTVRPTDKALAAGRRIHRRVKPDVVAALGLPAKVFAAKLGIDRRIEFAVISAAIEAAQVGLDVLLLSPEERVAEVVAVIEEANARSEDKIPYETLSVT
jgi:putative transcriptional regulator